MSNVEFHDLSIADFDENQERNGSVIRAINEGLTRYNRSARPDPSALPLVLALERDGKIMAGALGRSAYGWMRVDVVWVGDELRGRGYGEALMSTIEQIARKRRCRGIHLDTHGFQAPRFYQKLGYEVFGELPDYPEGESHYYLKKDLPRDGT